MVLILLLNSFIFSKSTLSDKEIIEKLAKLEVGQQALQKRMDDFRLEINSVREEINSLREEISSIQNEITSSRNNLYREMSSLRRELKEFMLWGFGITFAGIFALIGFVIWDRRTALSPVIRKSKEFEEREEKVERALKEIAKKDPNVAEALKKTGIL